MLVLARFDVRQGNQIVWTSEPIEPGSLPGLEFKMLPSGLHNRSEDTVYFVCGRLFGISVYASRSALDGNRDQTYMYALAALNPSGVPWLQETFLKHELAKFMDVRDTSVLDGISGMAGTSGPQDHPVLMAPQFLQTYGALVFELWKAGLARYKLLLAHPAADPGSPSRKTSLRELSQFSWLVSRLGSIPEDVQHLLPDHQRPAAEYPCWYTVGLVDMSRLQGLEAYVGTTTDGLLLNPQREVCDMWTDAQKLTRMNGESPLRPTWRDRRRFYKLMDTLGLVYRPPPHHDGNLSWLGLMDRLVDSTSVGLMWWASAGESALMGQDDEPLMTELNGVAMIGQFQQYTRQLVRVFSKLAQDDEGMIFVGPEHIAAMGLDPVAQQDRQFLQRFSLMWWDRPVCFRGCCC